jgi:hypothetical protein
MPTPTTPAVYNLRPVPETRDFFHKIFRFYNVGNATTFPAALGMPRDHPHVVVMCKPVLLHISVQGSQGTRQVKQHVFCECSEFLQRQWFGNCGSLAWWGHPYHTTVVALGAACRKRM